MGTLGTFDSFTTARLGIYAAQHGLRVTGNNISNINTAGYTRQRVDQVSFKTGGNDRYASFLERHIGSGALVSGINQIRDPYLDIRYRNTSSSTAYYDTKLTGLQEIASILDEVGKGGSAADGTDGDGLLYAQLQDLMDQLRAYGASPTSDNNTLVRTAAETLTMMFRNYAGRLEQVRLDTEKDLTENVKGANEVLRNIRDLNKSIRDAELHGDKALELRDERNRQIDALSEYMHIKVEYTMEDVGAGIQVEKLTISLANDNPDPKVDSDTSVLVDGLYATQLSIPEEKPSMNPYQGITENTKAEDLTLNPDYPAYNYDLYKYLKDYSYTKEASADSDEVKALLAANPPISPVWVRDENGNIKFDEKGQHLYLIGTNDPTDDGIILRKNDNYTIQLGKLLNVKGEKWESSKTTWTAAGSAGANAIYKATFQLAANGTLPQTVIIDRNPITKPAQVTTLDEFAAFIAGELNNLPNQDYTITAQGADIFFTAKTIGAVDGNGPGTGPANPPTLTLTNGGDLTLSNAAELVAGKDADNIDQTDAGTTTDPVTGNETTIAYSEIEGTVYRIVIETQHTREVVLDDNDLFGSLQAQREMLTEEGEFSSADDITIDENAKTKRGIPYYQKSFDLLAQQIAKSFNELNQGYMLNHKGNYVNKDGTELIIANEPISKYNGLTDDQKTALEKANLTLDKWLENSSQKPDGAVKMGGPLFSNSNDGNDTDGITASNIDVSSGWSSNEWMVIPKFEVLFPGDEEPSDENPGGGMDHTTQNININHMISLMDAKLVYDPKNIDPDAMGANLFTGSFNDMFSNMMAMQAKDAKATNIALNNDYTTLVALDSSREGISGVDLNDEAMNMMQYQKAMNAAMRLMTTIDEALDRLINNTGVAGR